MVEIKVPFPTFVPLSLKFLDDRSHLPESMRGFYALVRLLMKEIVTVRTPV